MFPGTQGGPLEHVIAAKAVCFGEALKPEFKEYARKIVENAQALAAELQARGVKLVSGGTDNHLMLIDLRGTGVTVNAMHPGAVASGFKNGAAGLARTLIGGFYAVFGISPEKGADTILHLAGSPEVADVTGEYFVKRRPATTSKACRDAETRRRLWEVSEELVSALDEA